MTKDECRKTCDTCWDDQGGKWPCAKHSMKSPTPSPISQAAGARDPGAYDIRSTLETITLLCEENGEPCDGFRFRELILKARTFLSTAPTTGSAPVCEHEWEPMTVPHKECVKCGDVRLDHDASPAASVMGVTDPEIHLAMIEATKRSRTAAPNWAWIKAFSALLAASMGGDKS